jgi:hypothetical protein
VERSDANTENLLSVIEEARASTLSEDDLDGELL